MKTLKERLKKKLGEEKTDSLRKVVRVVRVVKITVCCVLIAVLTLAVIAFLVAKIRGEIPSLFGYSIQRIISGSMAPTLEIGDVIISKEVTDTSEVHVNDIVTFRGDSRFDNQKVTHRVMVSPHNDGNGGIVIVTKGDANEFDDGEINYYDVESKYVAKANILRDLFSFFFSKWGLLVFIFFILLIFFDDILNIVKVFVHSPKDSDP